MRIIELDRDDQAHLILAARTAYQDGRKLRLAVEDDALKWKVGEGIWSRPHGHLDPESDAARREAEQLPPCQLCGISLSIDPGPEGCPPKGDYPQNGHPSATELQRRDHERDDR